MSENRKQTLQVTSHKCGECNNYVHVPYEGDERAWAETVTRVRIGPCDRCRHTFIDPNHTWKGRKKGVYVH